MSRPKKSLSQNFLSDPRILARIADAVGAGDGDTVLEIGPGPGGLTRELLKRAGRVVAIEKDRELAEKLGALSVELQAQGSKLIAHEGDALAADWHQLAGPDAIICGNIPYHITTPLIDKALQPPRARRVVFLMQKEVAERIVAPPGGEEYGALSIGVQAVATVERLFVVARGSFHPIPKVDSAVVRFTPLAQPLIEDREVADFRRFTVGIFSYRRKQLARAIRELTGFSADEAARVITRALASMPADAPPFSADSRPEQVPPPGFVSLCRAVFDAGWRAK
ncbi:MAG TPA: 16S rRNA (adenine(1518)-N(6)/adenine(1519)-N(6))-dimethyltransferase RsmA [Gemmatimonadales bacterium]|nr:16S rRNA (adenine(1518)-N(6)/adenine(1519)-N(6))-dimethyltransferase RsmA [Gemmatimonadales bacterium]